MAPMHDVVSGSMHGTGTYMVGMYIVPFFATSCRHGSTPYPIIT